MHILQYICKFRFRYMKGNSHESGAGVTCDISAGPALVACAFGAESAVPVLGSLGGCAWAKETEGNGGRGRVGGDGTGEPPRVLGSCGE
jgi:hypothetical protein